METQRGKLELVVEGRKLLGQVQCRNHTNGGAEVWGQGRTKIHQYGWHGDDAWQHKARERIGVLNVKHLLYGQWGVSQSCRVGE